MTDVLVTHDGLALGYASNDLNSFGGISVFFSNFPGIRGINTGIL